MAEDQSIQSAPADGGEDLAEAAPDEQKSATASTNAALFDEIRRAVGTRVDRETILAALHEDRDAR